MFKWPFSSPRAKVAVAPARQPSAARQTEALLQRLEWTVIRRLDGWLQGDHRTLMRGSGLDLADLREYQHHDDVRHMDWNVTARLQQPHVRVFTEDREMTAWFLLDLSPSLNFGSGEQRKSEVLQGFVGVLARIISRHGNRVGALWLGGGLADPVGLLPARGGRAQVLALLDQIQRAQAAGFAASEGAGVTRLDTLLQRAGQVIRQRSTVFVVSDFISEPGWEQALGALAQRHDVVAVRVVDPLEMDLPDMGLVTVRDAETSEQLLVDTHDTGFRHRYARVAAQREAALRESLARAGVDTLELATDDVLLDAVVRFVDLRRGRQRLRGHWPRHLAAGRTVHRQAEKGGAA